MPRVSVISIALSQNEFLPILEILKNQTYLDFEFVGEAGGTIPEAWNRAIARAQGEILVFTETDARPVDDHWLEDLVESIPDDHTVVKGLEVTSLPWNMCNLAGHRQIFEDVRFDENLLWAEDTEYFCQLKQQGIQLLQLNKAPVIHLHGRNTKRMIRRAFRYGMYFARIRYRYAAPVEVSGLGYMLRGILMYILQFIGFIVGSIIYLPARFKRSA